MITSTANQKVKELLQLQKKSKFRNKEKVFIAEGSRMVLEAPMDRVVKLYVSESYYKKHKAELTPYEGKIEMLTDTVYGYVSDTKTPQGILAVIRQMEYELTQMTAIKNSHLLVLDNLQDPGNLGTIFRTAEAAGVTGIIMSKDCVDIYNPKTIRSTMGAIYRMPFLYAEDIVQEISNLKMQNVNVYAAHLEGEKTYDQVDFRGSTAFLVGNEGNGLREEVAACAEYGVIIPMAGQVESLNAAIAATILMFEVSRQRRT